MSTNAKQHAYYDHLYAAGGCLECSNDPQNHLCEIGARLRHGQRVIETDNDYVLVANDGTYFEEDFILCYFGTTRCQDVATEIIETSDLYIPMCAKCKEDRIERIEARREERDEREWNAEYEYDMRHVGGQR